MGKRGPKPGSPYKYTPAFIEKEADAIIEYVKNCKMVPFEFEFAPQRGYCTQRLSEWVKINSKLSDALKYLKDVQKHRLVVFGLAGKINPAVAIFTLKNVSEWRDKQELEHTGEMGETKIVIVRPSERVRNETIENIETSRKNITV